MIKRTDRVMIGCQWDEAFEARRWTAEIPKLRFPPDWDVQITPPATGAIIRFRVSKNGGGDISVYLDGYGLLGAENAPYWEIYPAEGGDTERFAMLDTDGLIGGISRALVAAETPWLRETRRERDE